MKYVNVLTQLTVSELLSIAIVVVTPLAILYRLLA